jgi:DNA-binding MarR family transcriptional regulator
MSELARCVCFNTRKLSRCVSQMYDAALEPSGLKNTQFALLAMVSEREPISITELANAMAVERTTLTRNLKVLVRDGLLAVTKGADARSRAVTITAAGRNRVVSAYPLWSGTQQRLVERIGKQRWAALMKELEAICAATASG